MSLTEDGRTANIVYIPKFSYQYESKIDKVIRFFILSSSLPSFVLLFFN